MTPINNNIKNNQYKKRKRSGSITPPMLNHADLTPQRKKQLLDNMFNEIANTAVPKTQKSITHIKQVFDNKSQEKKDDTLCRMLQIVVAKLDRVPNEMTGEEFVKILLTPPLFQEDFRNFKRR